MQDLPPGWRVSNSSGSWSAPAASNGEADEDDEGAAILENEDLRPDSPGWEDMEDDTEVQSIKCLICDENFGSTEPMLAHSQTEHQFDLEEIRRRHKLDFIATIKLVNYIRAQVKAGSKSPDTTDASAWSDDKYMQPTLEDDALLFNLDELLSADERTAELGDAREYLDPQTEGTGQKVLVERALK